MSQVKIDLLIAMRDNFEDNRSHAKVRKIVTNEDGSFERYGLSFVTGEWIKVEPGCRYPDECLASDNLAIKGFTSKNSG